MNDTWRKRINLFYYNIFRFECFTQYLISYPLTQVARLTGLGDVMAKRGGQQNWDAHILSILNNPKGGISLHIAGVQVSVLIFLLLAIPWNIFCGIFQLNIRTVWPYGGVVALILAVIMSFYVAPDARRKYLTDFKKFEAMPKAKKRKFALLTLLIFVVVWLFFISSFVFYLRSLTQ